MHTLNAIATPLYQDVFDGIAQWISSGELQPGAQLPTLSELCDHYAVSEITVRRAVSELRRRGLVQTIRGRGAFVRGVPQVQLSEEGAGRELAGICVLSDTACTGFKGGIGLGIVEEAVRHDLPVRFEKARAFSVNAPSLPFQHEPGQGFIAVGGLVCPFTYSVLRDARIPSVLVDGALTGCESVLTDNHAGMGRIVDHLVELGHRRILLVGGVGSSFNSVNENERREAFERLVRQHGLDGEVLWTDCLSDVFARLDRAQAPTAVVFTQDPGALAFLPEASRRGIRIAGDLSVVGFDDFPEAAGREGLTTVRVDRAGLGRAAVRRLTSHPARHRFISEWTRVLPTLAIRASTAPPRVR